MHCFICVMYMTFLCSALPPEQRQPPGKPEQRSLFRDVIESLRIRSQLPEDFHQNDENNLAQSYGRYDYDTPPQQLPSDSDFVPRRNDRIEISSLRYRSPKSIEKNFTVDIETTETPKEEIVVYIDTNKEKSSTAKPKKPLKRPMVRPGNYKIKNKLNDNLDEINDSENQTDDNLPQLPMSNTMAGQSQIGNRESQIVVKPTVILNFRGSIMHKDGEVKLGGGRKNEENETLAETPQNIFNINQEIKLERTFAGMGNRGGPKKDPQYNNGEVKLESKVIANVEPNNMMMCETATSDKTADSQQQQRQERKFDNVLQILFAIE